MLKVPNEFSFPFEPYNIQMLFMKSLYQAIEEQKIGIFESPTGTGKSMSLICGALTWLRDHEMQVKNGQLHLKSHKTADPLSSTASSCDGDPFWIDEYVKKQKTNAELEKAKSLKMLLEKRERQRKCAKDLMLSCQTKREKYLKRKRSDTQDETLLLMEEAKKQLEGCHTDIQEGDEEFLLETYVSDDESEANELEQNSEITTTKIYFCSRTHSQLSQFIQELRKSPFGKPSDADDNCSVSVAALASRKTLCVNDDVRKLPSVHQMNEKCLEMQKSTKKKDSSIASEPKRRKRSGSSCSCSYYKNDEGLSVLTNKIVGNIMDMEDLLKEGKELVACPYYAARHSLPFSQLVVLPYQTLLHESTRSASGIDIRNSVIIIDEAHNLVEAINSMYSCQITAKQISKGLNQLQQYVEKFNKRLKAKNLFYVKQLVYVLRSTLTMFLDETSSDCQGKAQDSKTTLVNLSEFLFRAKLDNINFFKLLKYCTKSKISQKLNGFVEKYEGIGQQPLKSKSALTNFLTQLKAADSDQGSSSREFANDVMMRSPLMHIESFLKSLTSVSEDCRIAITKGKESSLKFLLLSPAQHFKQILDECRALIVAGGTMQPTSCFIDQLISRSDSQNYLSRIVEFSCGHVIDGATQLLPIVLTCGPSNKQFEFTFEKRKDISLLLELGRTLLNVINIIPGGMVCFFPSYDYENYVFEIWRKEGIIEKLDRRKKLVCLTLSSMGYSEDEEGLKQSTCSSGSDTTKNCNHFQRLVPWIVAKDIYNVFWLIHAYMKPSGHLANSIYVFREPKNSSQVDEILNSYSKCIARTKSTSGSLNGAILLCVVNGKMSEGINFCDDLGRCVVMIGLPYPNLHSPELKEKLAYLNQHLPKGANGRSAGQIHYENLCMKAVNQSIGRAIRHKNDYACLLFADLRYSKPSVKNKLPKWIGDHLKTANRFGEAFSSIRKFFNERKENLKTSRA